MSPDTAARDAEEQEAARRYADELAAAAGREFAAKHPDGRGWAACACGLANCWAEVAREAG